MAANKTILSVIAPLRSVLSGALGDVLTTIYSVYKPTARTPYVTLRRMATTFTALKGGIGSTATASVEVRVYTATYDEGVRIAETVRATLDNKTLSVADYPRVRRCLLSEASEFYEADAYVQELVFDVNV